jgi:hypothetical protein
MITPERLLRVTFYGSPSLRARRQHSARHRRALHPCNNNYCTGGTHRAQAVPYFERTHKVCTNSTRVITGTLGDKKGLGQAFSKNEGQIVGLKEAALEQ